MQTGGQSQTVQTVITVPVYDNQQPQHTDLWIRPGENCCDSPILQAILNFICPGIGTLCTNQISKGVSMIVITLLMYLLAILVNFFPVLGLLLCLIIFTIISLIWRICCAQDVYVIATRLSKGQQVMIGECGNKGIYPLIPLY